MAVGGDFDRADFGGFADHALGLQQVGADDLGGVERHADAGFDFCRHDAGGIELAGLRVVFDDGAVAVFGAVEIRVVIIAQWLGEGGTVDGADDVRIAQIATD